MAYDGKADKIFRETNAARSILETISDLDPDFAHDVIEGETDLFEAIDAALTEVRECEAIEAGCDVVISDMQARKQKFAARKERLRGIISQAMVVCEIDTVKRPTATVTARKNPPKVIVTDESQIPSDYWKPRDPVLDKAKLSKAETPPPGTTLDNGSITLTIRKV